MSTREYTVKVTPKVGMSRAQLIPLVPDGFTLGARGSGSVVTVELVKIVGAYRHDGRPEAVWMFLSVGDRPWGTFETWDEFGALCSMSAKVPERCGWDVIVGFRQYPRHVPDVDSPQREGTDRHVVLHVTSRPA